MNSLTEIVIILGLTAASFIAAMLWTPLLTNFLYKHGMGKQIRKEGAPIYYKLHKKKTGTPTMGGILVWVTVLVFALAFWILARYTDYEILDKINFLSRKETLLPLGALIASAIVGLLDDLMGIYRFGPKGGGLGIWHKITIYIIIAAFGAWWFYVKLERDEIFIPFLDSLSIGLWYIPFFIFTITATAFSVNETDGLDGLAGGVLMFAFGAFGIISFVQGRFDLAAFCGVIIGSLVAFLWFNIYPARFIMGDTGAMSLGITLGIIAMLTSRALLLPLIGFILVIESSSVIAQVASKKIFRRKIFISTPIHHHFEAKGWPETKVTQRFWIIAGITTALGLIIYMIGG